MKSKTICLNMIVKNESHVIRRCLESVKGLIDYWVIVDTGSTDGTQAVIRDYLQDIPGELHERPWKNFGFNRNEALELARGKADYFLFIDADDRLLFSGNFTMPELEKDYYYAIQNLNHVKGQENLATNLVVLLIKDLPDFKWVGPVHEVLSCVGSRTFEILQGVTNEYLHDGQRSKDPKTFEKDVQALLAAIEEEPTNSRNVFFLAQSYRGMMDFASAIKWYETRSRMGGKEDEVYYSLFCIGHLQKSLNYSPDVYLASLSKAYRYRPSRAEPLFEMVRYYVDAGNYFLGYLISKLALSIPKPSSLELWVDPWVYDWGRQLTYFFCTFKLGYKEAAQEAALELLQNPTLPALQRREIEGFLSLLEQKGDIS